MEFYEPKRHLISDVSLNFRGKNSKELKVKLGNMIKTTGKFEIGFKKFMTYFSWYNVYEGRDTIVISKGNSPGVIKVPEGAYNLIQIKEYIDSATTTEGIDFELDYNKKYI